MIRRMVTRLVVAKLMQVTMKTGRNALRKRKAARDRAEDKGVHLDKSSNDTFIEKGDATKTP